MAHANRRGEAPDRGAQPNDPSRRVRCLAASPDRDGQSRPSWPGHQRQVGGAACRGRPGVVGGARVWGVARKRRRRHLQSKAVAGSDSVPGVPQLDRCQDRFPARRKDERAVRDPARVALGIDIAQFCHHVTAGERWLDEEVGDHRPREVDRLPCRVRRERHDVWPHLCLPLIRAAEPSVGGLSFEPRDEVRWIVPPPGVDRDAIRSCGQAASLRSASGMSSVHEMERQRLDCQGVATKAIPASPHV